MDVAEWVGPQPSSDLPSVRRHRFHQSWYRAFVLGVLAGSGPGPGSTSTYGNMLRAEDAAAGRNFLTDEIHAVANQRIDQGGTVEPFRCRHNLLSSQPMCFNLFGPLISRPDAAAAFVTAVTGRDVTNDGIVVLIEDSPGYLGDATGLDASIRYRTEDGASGVLAIETKYTEAFSPQVYEVDSKPAYRDYSTTPDAPFDTDRLDELTDTRWNQLWRNQLLAQAVKHREELDHAEQVVVFPDDADGTAAIIDDYAELLTRRDAIRAWTFSEVLTVLAQAVQDADHRWLDAFRTRYVDLHLSDSLFDAWRAGATPFNLDTTSADEGD